MHLAHHLTDDNLEVLVIDFHTLQAIHILHLVDDILLNSGRALDGQNVAGSDETVGERCTGTYSVILLNKKHSRQRNEIFTLFARLRGDGYLAVTTFQFTQRHHTVDFAYHSGVRRIACLEEFGHTRQTTGDITTLGHTTRNLDEGMTCLNGLSVFDNHVTAYREVVCTHHIAIGINDFACGHAVPVFRLDDNFLSQTCGFIGLSLEGNVLNHIAETQCTGIFGDDDSIKRVPLGYQVALLHHIARLEVERRTVRHTQG